jgi:hypothetical protein
MKSKTKVRVQAIFGCIISLLVIAWSLLGVVVGGFYHGLGIGIVVIGIILVVSLGALIFCSIALFTGRFPDVFSNKDKP